MSAIYYLVMTNNTYLLLLPLPVFGTLRAGTCPPLTPPIIVSSFKCKKSESTRQPYNPPGREGDEAG